MLLIVWNWLLLLTGWGRSCSCRGSCGGLLTQHVTQAGQQYQMVRLQLYLHPREISSTFNFCCHAALNSIEIPRDSAARSRLVSCKCLQPSMNKDHDMDQRNRQDDGCNQSTSLGCVQCCIICYAICRPTESAVRRYILKPNPSRFFKLHNSNHAFADRKKQHRHTGNIA